DDEIGFDYAPVGFALPRVEVAYMRDFDLETGLPDNGTPDFTLRAQANGFPAQLSPIGGARVARLSPGFYDTLTAQDAAGLMFDALDVSLEPDPMFGEVGPVVILIETSEGHTYKLRPDFATSLDTYGFDYAPL
ncbi:hypothetical protein KKF91_18885, partial [Myxococcota bacterium]|nr:hypothetical protein [Myxococcota bacterium]